MKYEELECINEYGNLVGRYDVESMGAHPSSKPIQETVHSHSIWDDSSRVVEAYRLDDILVDLAKAGWEYKSTYWRGGSAGDAHKVFCFINYEY